MDVEMQRFDMKRNNANETRLNAIRSRVKQNEDSRNQIRKSLQALDNEKNRPNHIQFSDSDGTDDELTDYGNKTSSAEKCDELLGFNGSDDNEDDNIKIKPQFQGKAGQKLLGLQSGYGNDRRFLLDERFATEESESSADESPAVSEKMEDIQDEKRRNMEILGQVIGYDVKLTLPSKKKPLKFVDTAVHRYDPSKSEQFEIKPQKNNDPASKKRKKKRQSQELPEVDSRKFYKTSTDVLKNVFAGNSEIQNTQHALTTEDINDTVCKPFSFLAMMGRDEDLECEVNEKRNNDYLSPTDLHPSQKEKGIGMPTLGLPFQYDSSDTEDEKETNADLFEDAKMVMKSQDGYPTMFFMTSPKDPRLVDGVREFCWNKAFDDIQKEWLEVKDALIQDYKKKHRDAKRKAKVEERQERLRASEAR